MNESVTYKRHPVYTNYMLSSDGNIFSLLSGKFLKPCNTKCGYKAISLVIDKTKNKTFLLHRLIAQTFLGNFIEEVNHKNLIKTDNRVENLEHVTRSENSRHAYMGKKRFVYRDNKTKRKAKYYIQIQVKNTPFISGGKYFMEKEEAYEYARDLYFKHFGVYPW